MHSDRFLSLCIFPAVSDEVEHQRLPGFETDIHGLVAEEEGGQRKYFVDCVR